jgi:hypothetical protein
MFRSRKKNRRRDRSNLNRSRKLGVELMEGRMMLSATGFEGAVPLVDTTQISFFPLRYMGSYAHVAFTVPPNDGGYINSDALTGITRAYGQNLSTADGVIPQQLFGVAGQSLDVVPIWQTNNSFFSDSDTNGLQPAVIVASVGNDSPLTHMAPVVVGPSPSMPGPSEGGSIPIHAIFADFHQDSHLASGVKAVSSPAGETSVESLASARRLSAPDNAISGEWARAMVFEIAGGEPTASDSHSLGGQHTTSDSDPTLQNSKPLSSVDAPQQNVKLVTRHTSGQPTEVALIGEPGQQQATQSNEQLAAIVAQLLKDGKLTTDASAPTALGQLLVDNPDIATLASAAAFDQLGEENAPMIESSVDGKSWLRSIGTSPLLMALALERIAALNSRRATRELRIEAAKKPLRLRS